jgi:predicted HTH transcriptional regulator
VFEDTSYWEKFFYNLLTGSKHELKNRYAHIDYVQEENQNETKASNQTLEEQAIINILKEDPTTTQEEIATKINKSVRTVKNYMSEMQDKGLIERVNSKKSGEWVVND